MTIEMRLAELGDAEGILAIYAPFCESSTVTFETVPPTREEMRARIERTQVGYPWIVSKSGDDVVGYAYGMRFRERAAYRWTAEVAIYVAPGQQRRGLGRALYQSLFSILRYQQYSKAIAGITLPNLSSVNLHEGLGFQKVGHFPRVGYKNGTWLDVGWWQLSLDRDTSPPREPIPFSQIRTDAAVRQALDDGGRQVGEHV